MAAVVAGFILGRTLQWRALDRESTTVWDTGEGGREANNFFALAGRKKYHWVRKYFYFLIVVMHG